MDTETKIVTRLEAIGQATFARRPLMFKSHDRDCCSSWSLAISFRSFSAASSVLEVAGCGVAATGVSGLCAWGEVVSLMLYPF